MKKISVRVPAKIMLAGEYAVLRGGRCLAATLDSWLTLVIQEATGRRVRSDLWRRTFDLDQVQDGPMANEPLVQSLLSAAQQWDVKGYAVHVQSELNIAHGLGSSAAVRLAAELAMQAFALQKIELSADERWSAARRAWMGQKEQQGFASGYDTVVQLEGGLVDWTADYSNWPGPLQTYDAEILENWVHPFVGGKGAPTPSFGMSTRQWLQQSHAWDELMDLSAKLSDAFRALLLERSKQDLSDLLEANQAHRQLFAKSPGFPQHLLNTLRVLPGFDRSWSFKTTGAGGEDAILLIGATRDIAAARVTLNRMGWHPLGLRWQNKGSVIAWQGEIP